jgi:hypothetical protein
VNAGDSGGKRDLRSPLLASAVHICEDPRDLWAVRDVVRSVQRMSFCQ